MAKPVVDGLERRFSGRLSVARVDIGTDEGAEVARKYGVAGVPAFIVVDPKGVVLYRQVGGRPDGAEIERRLAR